MPLVKEGINEAFGKVIKELREERGLSQQELADYSELDRSYISDMERGRYNATLHTIYKLAEVLKVAPNKLLERVDSLLKR
ncbi:MAG: helix-turn-helix transcriptional regulator [Bacteroidetes bacterium]|nr:helix-turn-helix transcriptional regulator [Bacteroidota bacterium]